MSNLFPKKIGILTLILFVLQSQLFSQPIISSFSPTSGPVGTTVTINGSGFNSTIANNVVHFGAVKATITSASATSLTVTVPSGATYQPVSVTTGNLTGASRQSFDVTFAGGAITASSLSEHTEITGRESPYSVAAGDIDGDGKPDLVVVNGGYPYTVSIFWNKSSTGAVSFTKLDIPAGTVPFAVALGDFDGDGRLDIAITNTNGFNVEVYRNMGYPGVISFYPAGTYPVGSAFGLAAGDVDGDGKTDLVATNLTANTISILRNTTTGVSISGSTISFAAKTDIATGTNPRAVSLNDLDGDGKMDIIVSNSGESSISVYKNNSTAGSLSLGAKTNFTTGSGAYSLSIADLDGDGKPDVSVSSSAGISVLKNNSTAGTISLGTKVDFATAPGAISVQAGDIDGDGKPDLAVAAEANDSITVLRNTSSSGNISFAPQISYPTGSSPYDIAVVDMDGDGKPDLATVDQTVDQVSLFHNIGAQPDITAFTPTFGGAGTTVIITGKNFSGTTAVSFGGTSAASFTVTSPTTISAVLATGASGDVTVTTPKGAATAHGFIFYQPPVIDSFTPNTAVPGKTVTIKGSYFKDASAVSFGGVAATSFTVVDSATITAVVGVGASGSVSVTTPGGTATRSGFVFGTPTITSFTPKSGPPGTTVTITGSNFSPTPTDNFVYFGGMRATVTAATFGQLTVTAPPAAPYQPITVTSKGLTGISNIPFIETTPAGLAMTDSSFGTPTTFNTGVDPTAIKMVDIDGDGKPDMAVSYDGYRPNGVSILRNTSTTAGVLSYAPKVDVYASPGSAFPSRVAFADLDGDGRPDMIIPANGLSNVQVFQNTSTPGNISFASPTTYGTGDGPYDVAIGDIDGDGKPDLAVANFYSNSLNVYINTSNGQGISFAPGLGYATGGGPNTIAIGDLDGDGKPDLVTANNGVYDHTVSVLRNTTVAGAVSFAPQVTLNVGSTAYPNGVAVGDLDGDGKLDIVASNFNSGTNSIFKNLSTPGTLSFDTRIDIPSGGRPNYVAIGDIDGDGKPDLAISNSGIQGVASTVSVIKNTSTGGAISFAASRDFTVGLFPAGIFIADANGDGKPDLEVALQGLYSGGYTIAVLANLMTPQPPPQLSGFSPDTAKQGDTITIRGKNLNGASVVSFGDRPAAYYQVSGDTVIKAVVANGASGDVKVVTPGGNASLPGFVYTGATVVSFTPDKADSGTTVTIKGTHFTGATAVGFGGTPATSFTVVSDTSITAVVGAGSTGYVSVVTPAGTDSLNGFTFIPPVQKHAPVIQSFSPTNASAGETVTIKGQHFTGATGASFGGMPAASFTAVSDTIITAVVGTGATGYVNVQTTDGVDTLRGFVFIDTTATTPPPPVTPPVDSTFHLVHFSGGQASTQVLVQWDARNEVNVAEYVILRGSDSNHLSPITTILPQSSDTSLQHYNFTDPNPGPGRNYYQLEMVDKEGNTITSNILVIQMGGASPALSTYPNPARTSITVIVPNTNNPSVFQLVDLTGRVLTRIQVDKNVPSVNIPISGYMKGVYKLEWRDGINTSYGLVLILK